MLDLFRWMKSTVSGFLLLICQLLCTYSRYLRNVYIGLNICGLELVI